MSEYQQAQIQRLDPASIDRLSFQKKYLCQPQLQTKQYVYTTNTGAFHSHQARFSTATVFEQAKGSRLRRSRLFVISSFSSQERSSETHHKQHNDYIDTSSRQDVQASEEKLSTNNVPVSQQQHDPAKIAICWNFLQDNCPNDADTCNLSHDPTPERTPLCLHFLNKGRCTRQKCLFPHVNVGARHGVCRDFAVLGYCEKGLDCDKQHVRECPDFAEKGTCSTKGCKLPHVIRANRNRKPLSATATSTPTAVPSGPLPETEGEPSIPPLTANDAQMGDEYISLTFNESESEDDEEDEEEEEEEEDGDDEDEAEASDEGDDPDDITDLPVVG
ncbi:hypothetical protein V5O48_004687 [Marasmius crinis-equi]|uniref:C3H1-type domain-containing protein n=1 Tax=Marasmius crinis-equi TaxID=585013 RepID=A0ABR3FPC2_9AGAR